MLTDDDSYKFFQNIRLFNFLAINPLSLPSGGVSVFYLSHFGAPSQGELKGLIIINYLREKNNLNLIIFLKKIYLNNINNQFLRIHHFFNDLS